jgi:hypothetical protein
MGTRAMSGNSQGIFIPAQTTAACWIVLRDARPADSSGRGNCDE